VSELRELLFQRDGELQSLLPAKCSIIVSCYEQREIQQLVATTMQAIFESLARTGMDLRALDGITLTPDWRHDIRSNPEAPGRSTFFGNWRPTGHDGDGTNGSGLAGYRAALPYHHARRIGYRNVRRRSVGASLGVRLYRT
jgi:hypothetical protein